MNLTLVDKKDEAPGVKSFFWKPETPVQFLAGQYFYYTIPVLRYPDSRGNTRHFTISSAPTENGLIRLTTKIHDESGYKKTLDEIPFGGTIAGEGPNGTFTLDEKSHDTNIFVAGGIGITPFRSMIKDSSDKSLPVKMNLIYSNSDNNFIFGEELKEIDKNHDNIQVELFNSTLQGHLDSPKIDEITKKWKLDTTNCIWWLCGPPGMVTAIEESLEKIKVPYGNIRSEKFTGY